MKKLSLLLALLLTCFSLVASAAPARDLTDAAFDQEELIAQVQPLTDAVAQAAFTLDLSELKEGEAPSNALVEGLLARAYQEFLLITPASEISLEEVGQAATRLFFADNLPGITGAVLPDLRLVNDQVVVNMEGGADFVGTHVYDIALDEEGLTLLMDVYRLNGIKASAVEAPEESLIWLGAMSVTLRPKADAQVGFALSAFSVKERYQETSYLQFTQKNRFELQYPDIFQTKVDAGTSFLGLATVDGAAQLVVREEAISFENLIAAWQKEKGDGVDLKIENDRAILIAPGLLRLAYGDPLDGQDACLVLEMRYPIDRELEFTLIRTFLDNSFVVYSHSVG